MSIGKRTVFELGIPADPRIAAQLVRSLSGRRQPLPTRANVMKCMLQHKRFLRFNKFTFRIETQLEDKTWVEWTDAMTNPVIIWLQNEYGFLAELVQAVEACLLHIARENAFHPVREYLDRLVWDGTPRISRVLIDYVGAEETAVNYLYSHWFMVSLIARIYRPGCKLDTMLVLIGEQGLKKSTFFKTLAVKEEWHNDSTVNLEDQKDLFMSFAGCWIKEVAELDKWTNKVDASGQMKSLLSSGTDNFRPPYGKVMEKHQRSSLIVGTANEDRLFTDPTGNRRYFPVKVNKVTDIVQLRIMLPQLLAEARDRFFRGDRWWPHAQFAKMASEQVQDFSPPVANEAIIVDWAMAQKEFQLSEIADKLNIMLKDRKTYHEKMYADILKKHGFTKHKKRKGTQTLWFWYHPDLVNTKEPEPDFPLGGNENDSFGDN